MMRRKATGALLSSITTGRLPEDPVPPVAVAVVVGRALAVDLAAGALLAHLLLEGHLGAAADLAVPEGLVVAGHSRPAAALVS